MPLVNANALSIPLADDSVHFICFSPPYFRQRRYAGGDAQLGSEETVSDFIANLVAVARECRRVLRDDGIMAINIGDSYNGSGGQGAQSGVGRKSSNAGVHRKNGNGCNNFKSMKQGSLFLIPDRLRIALSDDGWKVFSTFSWIKYQSTMPESVSGWRWEQHRIKTGSGKFTSRRGANPETRGTKNGVVGKYPQDLAKWIDCPGCPVCTPNNGLVLKRANGRPTTAHESWILCAKGTRHYWDNVAIFKSLALGTLPRMSRGMNKNKWTEGPTNANANSLNRPERWNVHSEKPHALHQPRPNKVAVARAERKNDGNGHGGNGSGFQNHSGYFDGDGTPRFNEQGRNRRTSDWWNESLEAAAKEAREYAAYLEGLLENGGLVVNEEGDPIGLMMNPQPFSAVPDDQKMLKFYCPVHSSLIAEEDRADESECTCKNKQIDHYAAFPPDMVIPLILAATSARGYCSKCGEPWVRVVERQKDIQRSARVEYKATKKANGDADRVNTAPKQNNIEEYASVGWRPSCQCEDAGEPTPAIVLDPFCGSGSTIVAAKKTGRIGIGLDLSLEYLSQIALVRAEKTATPESIEHLPLFAGMG